MILRQNRSNDLKYYKHLIKYFFFDIMLILKPASILSIQDTHNTMMNLTVQGKSQCPLLSMLST